MREIRSPLDGILSPFRALRGTPGQADGQIIDRFGNELIARNGDFIVNLPQAA